MGVVDVKLVQRSETITYGANGYTGLVDVYRVRRDTAADGAFSCLAASSGGVTVPAYGSAHSQATSAKLARKTVTQDGDRLVYLVRCEYESPRYGTFHVSDPDNPLADSPRISASYRSYVMPAVKDQAGSAVRNSAGDPFDPSVEKDVYRLNVRILRNEATYSVATGETYIGSVNNAQVTIAGKTAAARSARMINMAASDRQIRGGVGFHEVTYEIEFAEELHDVDVVDQGLYQVVGGNRIACTTLNAEGLPEEAVVAQGLNGSGVQLAVGAATVYLTWRLAPERDWSTLSLPTAFVP